MASSKNGHCGTSLLERSLEIKHLRKPRSSRLLVTFSTHVSAFVAKFASDKFAVSVMNPPKSNLLRR